MKKNTNMQIKLNNEFFKELCCTQSQLLYSRAAESSHTSYGHPCSNLSLLQSCNFVTQSKISDL